MAEMAQIAAEQAKAAAADPQLRAPSPGRAKRRVAVGDPQTTRARFFALLEHHGLLAADGWLSTEVSLISLGDHFDFPPPAGMDAAAAGEEGRAILAWLAAHDPEQVAILLGNHDLGRVQELAAFDDESFAIARAEAAPIERLRKERGDDDADVVAQAKAFCERWPALPTTELADRDYSCFAADQRALVRRLLVSGRGRLALAERLKEGQDVLLTHAGITSRELDLLGEPEERGTAALAARLNGLLDERTAKVASSWERGVDEALDLGPLHREGARGVEGGGLLYHRPTRPEVKGDPEALRLRRRFAPAELPRGLVQACGHVGHKKCLEELGDWIAPEAEDQSPGALRSLVVEGENTRYGAFVATAGGPAAVLHMADGAMHKSPLEEVELLELEPAS
jgi:hypothetical protein